MKRDWNLIRALLCDESTAAYSQHTILEHRALCAEAGYTTERIIAASNGSMALMRSSPSYLTMCGCEVADHLRNADRLRAVLTRLDSLKVGHSSTVLFDLLAYEERQAASGTP